MANNSTPGVIACKAVVAWKPSEPLTVEEICVEPPNSTEVRIKMMYASICHTDITLWKGFFPMFPRIFGHEGAGVIESVGEEVRGLKVGDTVMLLYCGECGECSNCTTGKTNLCSRYPIKMDGLMLDGTSRMSVKGRKLYHMFSCSTWSEYTVIESNYVVKVDPRVSLPEASLLTCGFTTGYGAAWRELNVEKGSTVAVIGLGAVGLGAVNASRILGASKIIGIDINEMKRDKARAFGVTDFINPKHSDKTVSQLIQEATGGVGVDYCIECTGAPSLLDQAIASTKVGVGEVALISAGDEKKVDLSYIPLLMGRSVKGTTFGGVRIHSDLPKIVDKCINKEIVLDELITHEISFADVSKGFMEYMKQPDCVKVIIKF